MNLEWLNDISNMYPIPATTINELIVILMIMDPHRGRVNPKISAWNPKNSQR